MRVVIQRVLQASVSIQQKVHSQISNGLLLLVGFEQQDTVEDINWLSNKISKLRIFNDEKGQMNQSVIDIEGQILVVSQFTLHAKTKKGNRPSFILAANPEKAKVFYQQFIHQLSKDTGLNIMTGEFGADMQISLCNSGPVTILIDSKNRE